MSERKTTPESVLKRIARLRKEHTRNFNLQRWQANDTVSRKIREAWAQYHRITTPKLETRVAEVVESVKLGEVTPDDGHAQLAGLAICALLGDK